jgi:hypothetical protein
MIIIDEKEPIGPVFSLIYNNPLMKKGLKKERNLKTANIFSRLFRVATLGDILYKQGKRKFDKEGAETEILAVFFESFIFLLRTVYDYLLDTLQYECKEKLPESFNHFIKNIKKGRYPEIQGRFREHLLNKAFSFEEIRNLRDSIKRKTASVYIYLKDKTPYVHAIVYERNKSEKNIIDMELSQIVFNYTAIVSILMFYIDRIKRKEDTA